MENKMAFSNEAPFQVRKHIALLNGVNVETIAADKTLTLADSTFQILNGGASDRDVDLPAETDGIWNLFLDHQFGCVEWSCRQE
jgi:hypothetical protein